MDWLIAAVISAILFSILAVISKELMDHIDSVPFTALYSLMAFIFYTPIFLFYYNSLTFEITTLIIGMTILSGLGNILGMLAYNYGLSHTSLSIAMPLNRIQPVFVAIIGFLFLNEIMNLEKVLGIVLVTIASYIILLENKSNPLDPITNLTHDLGAQLAIISAVLFSAVSVIDRFVTTNLPPEIYTYLILGIMAVTLNIHMLNKNKNYTSKIKSELANYTSLYIISGILTAAAYLAIYQAFSQAEASKVVPVLQLQVPLTIIAGEELYNETHILQKIIGATLLIIGIILVI